MKHSLRIGLDIIPMGYPPSGVRTYVEALIDAFRSGDDEIETIPLGFTPGSTRRSNRLTRLYWDSLGISASVENTEIDLVHMTRFAAPRACDRPLVVTVHDLIPLQIPEYRASVPARIQNQLASRTVRNATWIIVPSQVVAQDVIELLDISADRIDIIPMGVSLPTPSHRPAPFSGRYLLHAGGFDVRKNLPTLVRAFAQALPELEPDWRLILLGAPHTGNPTIYPPLTPEIARLGLQDRIIMTGRVSEAEKHLLYQHATGVVAPSLHEGFGLPILEAMAHGIPVIASNRTSHPEVAGDAALLVDPTETALCDAILRLAHDRSLRDELSTRGRQRARLFSWSRTAASTATTYRKAME